MPRYTQKEIKEFEEMKRKQIQGDLSLETEESLDIVIISKENNLVESISVWINLKNIERIKRLLLRENEEAGTESRAVLVLHRSVSMGKILTEDEIIKL